MRPTTLRPLCLIAFVGLLAACAAPEPSVSPTAWYPMPTQFTGGSSPVIAAAPQAQITVASPGAPMPAQPMPTPTTAAAHAAAASLSGIILGDDGVSAGMASRLETANCGVGLCTVRCTHETEEHLLQRAISGGCNVTGAATLTGNYPLAAGARDPDPHTATGWACSTHADANAQDVKVTVYALCANMF